MRREAVRSLDAAAVIRAICQAVAREYEVRLDAVGLVRPGSIARTTSGKIERMPAASDSPPASSNSSSCGSRRPATDRSWPVADEQEPQSRREAATSGRRPGGR